MFPHYPLENILFALQLIQTKQPHQTSVSLYYNQLRISKSAILNEEEMALLNHWGWFIDEDEKVFCYDF